VKHPHFFMCVLGCIGPFGAGISFANDLVMPDDAKHLKPGLWETTRQTEIAAPPIAPNAALLDGLDAAARARVEAVLKRQGAERAARGGGPEVTTRTTRECVTAEVLAKRKLSMDDDQKHHGREESCPPVVKSRTSSTVVVAADCEMEGHKVHIDMRFEIKSPEETITELTGSADIEGHSSHTKATAMSRWLGSACGDAKLAH
jgi:hypothetical protein